MARPSFRRFHPSAFSAEEAYNRATQTPREVRQLGEAVVGWALSNFARDGTLPQAFGFQQSPETGAAGSALSDHTTLTIFQGVLWCTSAEGSTVLSSSNFEPARILHPADATRPREVLRAAKRPTTPVDWIVGWNHAAAACRQLAKYEAWVQRRDRTLRSATERPKVARKTEVTVSELPSALDALAEWASDAEQAMLTWVIADAKTRGVEPELPARFHPKKLNPLKAILGRLTAK